MFPMDERRHYRCCMYPFRYRIASPAAGIRVSGVDRVQVQDSMTTTQQADSWAGHLRRYIHSRPCTWPTRATGSCSPPGRWACTRFGYTLRGGNDPLRQRMLFRRRQTAALGKTPNSRHRRNPSYNPWHFDRRMPLLMILLSLSCCSRGPSEDCSYILSRRRRRNRQSVRC